jgi:ABC-type multidrug transport system ATPase subunit
MVIISNRVKSYYQTIYPLTGRHSNMSAIEFDGVTKVFDDITAVSDLSLRIETGEVFGFLGPNGAGKSTTINMLLDFVRPTTGTVTALGVDAHTDSVAVRRRTGVLPEGFDVYDRLSGGWILEGNATATCTWDGLKR